MTNPLPNKLPTPNPISSNRRTRILTLILRAFTPISPSSHQLPSAKPPNPPEYLLPSPSPLHSVPVEQPYAAQLLLVQQTHLHSLCYSPSVSAAEVPAHLTSVPSH